MGKTERGGKRGREREGWKERGRKENKGAGRGGRKEMPAIILFHFLMLPLPSCPVWATETPLPPFLRGERADGPSGSTHAHSYCPLTGLYHPPWLPKLLLPLKYFLTQGPGQPPRSHPDDPEALQLQTTGLTPLPPLHPHSGPPQQEPQFTDTSLQARPHSRRFTHLPSHSL